MSTRCPKLSSSMTHASASRRAETRAHGPSPLPGPGTPSGSPWRSCARLDRAALAPRLESAAEEFRRAGAHCVIESVADLLQVLDGIEFLAASDAPGEATS